MVATPERRTSLFSWPLAAAVLVVFGVFTLRMMAYTDGHRAAPLDDTYIHLQYARQIARGDYFRYQPGDPPTTGATSWLYIHLLALPALFRIDGQNLLTAAAVMNLVFLYLCLYYLRRLATDLFGREAGIATVVLCLSSGAFLWGAFSQMEIALFSFLIVLCAWYTHLFLKGQGSLARVMLGATLLCLARPEGAVLSLLLAGLLAIQITCLRGEKHRIAPNSIRLRLLLLPLAAYVFQVALNWLLTGETASAGLLAKSEFYRPSFTWTAAVAASIHHFGHILMYLLGLSPERFRYLPPGMLLLFLAGLAPGFSRARLRGFLGSVKPWLLGGTLFAVASIATLFSYDGNNWRYFMPLFPLLFLGGVGGALKLGQYFPRRARRISLGLIVLLIASNASQWGNWMNTFGRDCGTHYKKQMQLARWIRNNLPEDARIAVNDAGILPYFSRRNCFDLIGLTTRGTTLPYRTGYGSLAEYLERLAPEERFDYYCVFPKWFPSFQALGLFGERLVRINDPYTKRRHTKAVFRACWDWAGSGDESKLAQAWPDWRIQDRLDVADLESEAAHGYQSLPGATQQKPYDLQARMIYHAWGKDWLDWNVLDGGRVHEGGERFVLRDLQPGHPARLVMRTGNPGADSNSYTAAVEIAIAGIPRGTWQLDPQPYRWSEVKIDLPGEWVTASQMKFQIRRVESSEPSRYTSFHYWILQPDLSEPNTSHSS